ncbi:MAG TPA: STAS domain-containing protein [Spirochaetota bacterium]|nr:STAS domain-containing protein [Spirochaetota bacterium]HOS39793.1 STAS domain-containing protein [Spirochaetota bacterium]HPU89739.1 STAS domain-containing protein [Spirochaetota bacterium]
MDNALSIGIRGGECVVVAEGEIRAGECFALGEVLPRYLDNANAPTTVYLDLARCTYMDSTFIGFIVGLAKRSGAGGVVIANPSAAASEALRKLSALSAIEIKPAITLPDVPTFRIARDTTAFGSIRNIELVFDAHRTLASLSEENRREFESLLHELSRVIESKRGAAS